MENRAKEIRNQIASLRAELNEIEQEGRKSQYADMVGKYYRYRNCYSCPDGDDDYWWVYYYCDHMDEFGNAMGVCFSVDKDGKATMETGVQIWALKGSRHLEEISRFQFMSAYAEFTGKLEKMETWTE